MDETKANTDAEQNLENQDENQQEAATEEVETTTEEAKTDIDFNEAPTATPKRTQLEKAEYTARSVLNRVAALGGDPTKVVKDFIPEREEKTTAGGFTRNDAEDFFNTKLAEQQARALAKSDKEFNAIMSWVKEKGLSVEDAHLLANRGKVKQAESEMQRAEEATASSTAVSPGIKARTSKTPQLPLETQQVLRRRGMKPEGDKWVGKVTEMVYAPTDPSANSIGWVTRKIQK